jgi:hypothetical protein
MVCVCSGSVYAEAASPGTMKTITLPSGEQVFDISGDSDVIAENDGDWDRFGSYSQVFRITQEDAPFTGIRLRDNLYRVWSMSNPNSRAGIR